MTKLLLALLSLLSTLSLAQNIDRTESLDIQTSIISRRIGDVKPILVDGTVFYLKAEDAERKGDFDTALTLFGKAAFEFNSNKNLHRYAQSITKMCQMHYQLGRFKDAEQTLLNVSLKNYSKLQNKTGLMNTYSQLAKVYLAVDKNTQSLWFYSQQGILALQLKNSPSYIESILGIADVKINKKDFTLASRDLNRAEFLARSIKSVQYKDRINDARSIIGGRVTALRK